MKPRRPVSPAPISAAAAAVVWAATAKALADTAQHACSLQMSAGVPHAAAVRAAADVAEAAAVAHRAPAAGPGRMPRLSLQDFAELKDAARMRHDQLRAVLVRRPAFVFGSDVADGILGAAVAFAEALRAGADRLAQLGGEEADLALEVEFITARRALAWPAPEAGA